MKPPIDMSDAAITRRLNQVAQLRRACLALKKAVPLKTEKEKPSSVRAD